MEADAKPEFEEATDKNAKFLHGTLGLIRALRMGGEPVKDYRSLPDAKSPFVIHVVLKPSTRKMSLRKNQFNPYEDLRVIREQEVGIRLFTQARIPLP